MGLWDARQREAVLGPADRGARSGSSGGGGGTKLWRWRWSRDASGGGVWTGGGAEMLGGAMDQLIGATFHNY